MCISISTYSLHTKTPPSSFRPQFAYLFKSQASHSTISSPNLFRHTFLLILLVVWTFTSSVAETINEEQPSSGRVRVSINRHEVLLFLINCYFSFVGTGKSFLLLVNLFLFSNLWKVSSAGGVSRIGGGRVIQHGSVQQSKPPSVINNPTNKVGR